MQSISMSIGTVLKNAIPKVGMKIGIFRGVKGFFIHQFEQYEFIKKNKFKNNKIQT